MSSEKQHNLDLSWSAFDRGGLVCKTPVEVIQSEEFQRRLKIVLRKTGNDNNIVSKIFEKLRDQEPLLEREKEILYNFVRRQDVYDATQSLVQDLTNNLIDWKIDVNQEKKDNYWLYKFADLVRQYLSEDLWVWLHVWYTNICKVIEEVADMQLGIINALDHSKISNIFHDERMYTIDEFIDRMRQLYTVQWQFRDSGDTTTFFGVQEDGAGRIPRDWLVEYFWLQDFDDTARIAVGRKYEDPIIGDLCNLHIYTKDKWVKIWKSFDGAGRLWNNKED